MKRILAALSLFCLSSFAIAQSVGVSGPVSTCDGCSAYVQFVANNISDLSGGKLRSGTITFTPVLRPGSTMGAAPNVGGVARAIPRPVTFKIVTGVVGALYTGQNVQLADVALANYSNFCYRSDVHDDIGGDTWQMDSCLQPTWSATWCTVAAGITTCDYGKSVPTGTPGVLQTAGPAGKTGPAGPSGVGADPNCSTDGNGKLSCIQVAASSMSASGIATTPNTAPICPNGPGGTFTITGCVAGSKFDPTTPGPIGSKTPDTGEFTDVLASGYKSKNAGPSEFTITPTCIVSGCTGGVGTLASITDAQTGKTLAQVADAVDSTDCGTGGGQVTHWCYCTLASNGICSTWATATQSGGSGGGVTSLNSLSGALSLIGGTGVTITPNGLSLTIALSSGSTGGAGTQKNCLSVACAGGSTYASGVIYTNTSGVAVTEEVTMIGPQNDNTGRNYEISATINGVAGPINGITNTSYGHASVSFVVPSGATFYVSVAQTQGGTVTPSPSIYSWLESPFGSVGGSTSGVSSFNGRTGAVSPASGDYTPSMVGLGNVSNAAQTLASVVPNTLPAAGFLLIGNSGGTAYVPVAISGDAILDSTGALKVTKSNGVAFGSAAFTASSAYDAAGAASTALASAEAYAANASNISSGTLNHSRLPALVSADIPNNAANTTGTAGGLSAAIAESQVTNLPSDLAAKQATITLTTTGTGGPATLSGATLNIPQYAGGGSMSWPSSAGIPVYGGSNAWGTSLTAPSGAIVGTSDTQTLTNKTIDGVTPTTMSYVDATSSIQAQLNSKQATLTNPVTGPGGTSSVVGHMATLGNTAGTQIVDGGAIPTLSSLGGVPAATTVNGHALTGNVVISAADLATGVLPASAVPSQYKSWACEPGIGAGLTAIPAGTYVQRTCFNTSGQVWSITGIKCYADSGASTVAVADNSGNNFLSTTNLTCSSTPASGTQSSTYTTIPSTGSVTFTFVADGTSKQATFIVYGVYN
ncbi:MAG: hypothetical protein P4K83_02290 [Terracidiphilus sp.]|nr:hypothetical protein [Terracidiphilus sp.]